MDYIINGIIVLLIVWFITTKFIPAKGVKQINTADLKKIVRDKGYQFIDVRTPMEFKGNHIKGFKNIPVADIKRRHEEIEKNNEVVVICQSGMRSSKATRTLRKLGFTKVTNVRGGMATWSHN